MLTVQNYRINPNNLSFKSNGEHNENQAGTNSYFKTHAGLKTGAVWAGLGTAVTLGVNTVAKTVGKYNENALKELDDVLGAADKKAMKDSINLLKASSNKLWLTLPISILTALGCGALVDKKINDKNAQFAQDLETKGKRAVLDEEDRADLTKKENVYYKSNTGKKLGTLLGVVVYPLTMLIEKFVAKSKIPVGQYIAGAAIGAVGGLILGSITDKIANKGAAKYADKKSVEI